MVKNKRKTAELTPEEIIVWAQSQAGTPQSQIAKNMGKGPATITRWLKKAREFIGEGVDIENFRTPLYGLYPLAVESLMHNLKNFDVHTTIALLKGLNILMDKKEIEGKGLGMQSSEKLIQELMDIGIITTPDRPGGEDSEGTGVPS